MATPSSPSADAKRETKKRSRSFANDSDDACKKAKQAKQAATKLKKEKKAINWRDKMLNFWGTLPPRFLLPYCTYEEFTADLPLLLELVFELPKEIAGFVSMRIVENGTLKEEANLEHDDWVNMLRAVNAYGFTQMVFENLQPPRPREKDDDEDGDDDDHGDGKGEKKPMPVPENKTLEIPEGLVEPIRLYKKMIMRKYPKPYEFYETICARLWQPDVREPLRVSSVSYMFVPDSLGEFYDDA